ncbi:MAG: hypothetical protein BroJett003_25900 [Planctomycetota bacterium]|nr:MAG: hypothetical protein BroJett003_25900 [Planctomycetota bacterium]
MMTWGVAQSELPPVLESIRQRMGEGGSVVGVLLALLGVGLIFVIAYALTRGQARLRRREWKDDPRALFQDLMSALRLDRDQQSHLRSLASSERLIHPSVILISEKVFDEAVSHAKADDSDAAALQRIRASLFPASPSARAGAS